MILFVVGWTVWSMLLVGCAVSSLEVEQTEVVQEPGGELSPAEMGVTARVISVKVSGNPGAYQFAVEVASPDTGCEQYADWWEVLSQDGELLYRRILAHSHVNEQPFIRSGGPVAVAVDRVVIVRAHMHPDGFGREAMMGSVQSGFEAVTLERGFAAGAESALPQPEGCGF